VEAVLAVWWDAHAPASLAHFTGADLSESPGVGARETDSPFPYPQQPTRFGAMTTPQGPHPVTEGLGAETRVSAPGAFAPGGSSWLMRDVAKKKHAQAHAETSTYHCPLIPCHSNKISAKIPLPYLTGAQLWALRSKLRKKSRKLTSQEKEVAKAIGQFARAAQRQADAFCNRASGQSGSARCRCRHVVAPGDEQNLTMTEDASYRGGGRTAYTVTFWISGTCRPT
jgi:hypothetical protein